MVFIFIEYGKLNHVTFLFMVFFFSFLLLSSIELYITPSEKSLLLRVNLYMGIDLLNIDWFEELFEVLELNDYTICCTMFRGWFKYLSIQTVSSFVFYKVYKSLFLNQNERADY